MSLERLRRRAQALAAKLGAPEIIWPEIDGKLHEGRLGVTHSLLGGYEVTYTERGEDSLQLKTRSEDEVLEHLISGLAWTMAVTEEMHHRRPGEEPRRQIFELHAAMLDKLDPAWGDHARARAAGYIEEHPLDEAPQPWIDHLPPARGRIVKHEPLAPFTWLRVGGPADVLFLPADAEDLAQFAKALHATIPLTIIGVGSNLLVRDGGVDGVVVRLGRAFANIEPRGDNRIYAGAAALDAQVAKAAAAAGIAGLEFYSGIPGTIGGACVMNAGCYGSETKDVLVEAYAINRFTGETITLSNAEMKFSYRHAYPGPGNLVMDGLIFIGALFQGTPDDPAAVQARIDEISARRETTQPIREKTGGSTFANPPGNSSWKLVDGAGWRGKPYGGAKFSELHANFLINTGDATAADLEGLGEAVRADVKEKFGVDLEWEIKRIGRR